LIKRGGGVSSLGEGSVSIGGDAKAPISTTHVATQNIFGMSGVPVGIATKDPQVIFAATGIEAFTGRDWLTGEADRFMAENPCGYVFVEAEAGLGKTAFAAWLVKNRGYLSHFSRYSGGRSIQVALQNLSAQLIRNYGLDDQAPGGILQEWAETPAGFESLLSRAAELARARQERLVIVIDGLDEAGLSEVDLSFGLPALLPDGVYVIGTYQTGHWPGHPESPSTTLRIRQHDPRNKDDVGLYLARVVAEDVLAARLASDGTDPAAFMDILSARCDGVWVYLRYVLQELRLGLREPNELNQLPSGLQDYYATQIRRWRRDLAWDTELLPLLATLGVAGEPLQAATLAKLAGGLGALVAKRRCDLTFRPLLNANFTPGSGTMQYEIYHASFRDFLHTQHANETERNHINRSYESLALAEELRRATLAAHCRVADIYLDNFGGLEAGLPALAADLSVAEADGNYPLRHLARHLYRANRVDDLRRLLTVKSEADNGQTANIWGAAHEHANTLILYLADLNWVRGYDIKPLLEGWSDFEKQVVFLRLSSNMTMRQIAKEFGITQGRVSQVWSDVMRELREGAATNS
jgi:hypothetical protein